MMKDEIDPGTGEMFPVAEESRIEAKALNGHAPPKTPWDNTANLRRRLLIAQSQVAALEKDATISGKAQNGTPFSYKGITAEQIITKAKAVLIANGILYTADVLEQRNVSGNKTAVYMRGYFENVDDPDDVIVRHAWGEGTDQADKGTAKATTNANKILLSRTLNMSTTEYEGVDIVNFEPEAEKAPEPPRIPAKPNSAPALARMLSDLREIEEFGSRYEYDRWIKFNQPIAVEALEEAAFDQLKVACARVKAKFSGSPSPAPRSITGLVEKGASFDEVIGIGEYAPKPAPDAHTPDADQEAPRVEPKTTKKRGGPRNRIEATNAGGTA